MHIKAFTYEYDNELYANTYIFYDDSKNCIVIDPSKEDEKVVKFIRSNGLALKAILLTHGHYDHIRGVDMLVEAFNAPVYVHKFEKKLLETPELNCSDRFSRKEVIIKSKTIDIEDGMKISGLDEEITVLFTPYHTRGSCCFYLKDSKVMFSGDSLFFEGLGRYDLKTSQPSKLLESLEKMLSLPSDTLVYPGHGQWTSIQHERYMNSFVKR